MWRVVGKEVCAEQLLKSAVPLLILVVSLLLVALIVTAAKDEQTDDRHLDVATLQQLLQKTQGTS